MDIDGEMTIFDPVIKESLCVKERHEWNEGASHENSLKKSIISEGTMSLKTLKWKLI